MASEQKESGDFHLKNFVQEPESANNEGVAVAAGASSLESTHSAESESVSSLVTQIEVISSSSSSSSKVIEKKIETLSSIQNQTQETANFGDAKKVERDQSSSVIKLTTTTQGGNNDSSSSTGANVDIDTTPSSTLVDYGMKSGNGEGDIQQQSDTIFTTTQVLSQNVVKKSTSDESIEDEHEHKHEREDMEKGRGEGGEEEENDDDNFDQSYEDDDTISSEAVVDDIELILMPETLTDFPATDLSPYQLVRVTELKQRPMDYYDTDVFEDDEDGRSEQEESDFQKFGTDDEENVASERSVSSKTNLLRRSRGLVVSSSLGGCGSAATGVGVDENEELSSRDSNLGQQDATTTLRSGARGRKSSGKVNSGSQTEITALEITSSNNPFELRQQQQQRRRSVGKSSSSRVSTGLGLSSMPGGSGGGGRKHLNWKSELTLLPSKTKIRTTGFSGYDESTNYQDQYSPRGVAKFTSQDTLSSNSQFLKPSTLYRTRNLSRNLNQCESSESTLVLPAAGLPSTSDSAARYRQTRMSSSTSSNFKDSYSSFHVSSSITRSRQPLTSGGGGGHQSVSFRSSLPDLSSQQPTDNNKGGGHRQSFKSMKYQKNSSLSGYRLTKKSSSDDDETSSLIDESERCLRSSIDLLLTDDLPSPGGDFSCRSTGFGGTTFFGYYSSRRSYSQPHLVDDGESGDLGAMGSPFLPRKLSDMRCSRWAKVILPNGHVSVTSVKDIDELGDALTVQTDTGCVLSVPFRKVVFAWRQK